MTDFTALADKHGINNCDARLIDNFATGDNDIGLFTSVRPGGFIMELELELVPLEDSQEKPDAQEDRVKVKYKGFERRKNARRTQVDRRDMVRFEEKTERRAGNDRRAGSVKWTSGV